MIALLIAAAAATANVGVSAREWRLTPYVAVVRRGAVTFNLHNYGEDAHDLQVRGPDGYRSPAMAAVESRENGTLTVTLRRAGSYRLICTLPGHRAKGMRAAFRVR